MLELHVLPAKHGDSLVVSYGTGRHVLIDGGPANSYETGLRAFLQQRPTLRSFELMVLTHVDTDHVDGLLCLMNDRDHGVFRGLEFGDVWFNGWPQLSAEHTDRGALQGSYLEQLLADAALPVNRAFGGGAVYRDLSLAVRLAGDALITVMTPGVPEMQRMAKEWRAGCATAGFAPDDRAGISARLANRKIYDPTRGTTETTKRPGADTSPPNGSSIGLLFEYDGRRLFLAGDAHARSMERALRGYRDRLGVERVALDLFKLPHHGSVANLTRDVLDLVDCRSFVVSTNGDRFRHPDVETLAMIAAHDRDRGGRPSRVYFNYAERITPAIERLGLECIGGDDGLLTISL